MSTPVEALGDGRLAVDEPCEPGSPRTFRFYARVRGLDVAEVEPGDFAAPCLRFGPVTLDRGTLRVGAAHLSIDLITTERIGALDASMLRVVERRTFEGDRQ